MVERMAPNHDIRVRFLEPLFAEISADFFHILLSALLQAAHLHPWRNRNTHWTSTTQL